MAIEEHARVVWVAVTDNRWARLFRCSRTPTLRWHADEPESIRNPWESHHDSHTPALGHKAEEETRRFAREAADWLDGRSRAWGIEHVTLFAPDHFLGALRAAVSPRLRPMIGEHALDLTHLRASELVEHPAVAKVLAAAAL